MLKFSTMERLVGAFILLTFLAFLGSVVMVGRGQKWFRKHNLYYSIYKEGYNLLPGTKVKLLRTDIGQVTKVELTDDNRVKVIMRILDGYASRIRADSKAAIESPTIIGDEYINIILGSKDAPIIQPGGRIPSKEQKKISEYLEELDVEHKLLKIDEILESVAEITAQLEDADEGVLGILTDIKNLTGTMARGEGNLGRIIKGEELYAKIDKELDAVEKILASLQKTADTTAGMAVDVKAKVPEILGQSENLIKQVEDILKRLQAISGQLEKAMNDVPEISQQARQGIRDVNQILESVKKNFLIRGNIPRPPVPESHGVEIRGD